MTARRQVSTSRTGGTAPSRYRGPVSSLKVPGGVVHALPGDLRQALMANPMALDAWKDITPLARNEFICWVENAKQEATRERRIRRTQEELEEGQRRPVAGRGARTASATVDSERHPREHPGQRLVSPPCCGSVSSGPA